jgi:cysteine desulfurase
MDQTQINGDPINRLPNTTNIGFERLEAEAILLLLSEQGICASAGAACSSGSLEPSHVLQAMKIDQRYAHGAIRFSLSRYTTQSEIDQTLRLLPPAIARLRAVLPVG